MTAREWKPGDKALVEVEVTWIVGEGDVQCSIGDDEGYFLPINVLRPVPAAGEAEAEAEVESAGGAVRAFENHNGVDFPRRSAVRRSEAALRPGEVGSSVICYPEDRWEPWQAPDVQFTAGPDRIYDDDPKPNGTRRVGFGVMPEPREPLLWEGDNA